MPTGTPRAARGGGGERVQGTAPDGRSRGGLATKLHVLAGAFGRRPMALALAPGQTADNLGLRLLIGGVPAGGHLVGDRGYGAARARGLVRDVGATPHIPRLANRATRESVTPGIYRARNAVERLINRLKHFRRVATRYDKTARNYLAAVTLAAVRIWVRFESTT